MHVNLAPCRQAALVSFSLSLSMIASAISVPTYADDSPTDIIVVTARHGNEDAKDIPFGLSVIDGETLEIQRQFDLEDALRSVPGVDVNSSGAPTLSSIRIRGVGSLYLANRDDTSVSLSINGVPTSTENISLATLDVERVEVLKGPQSSVFGRNSEAGVINITTRKPTSDFEASIRGEYGQENQYLAQSIINGPLAENLNARFAIRYTGSDHWIDNIQTGDPVTTPTDLALRGSLLWESGATSVLVSAEHQDTDEQIAIQLLRPFPDDPFFDVAPGRFGDNDKELYRYAAEISHEFSGSRLTSITAYTSYDLYNEVAFDRRLNQALFSFPAETVQVQFADERIISQDLRWTSLPSSSLFWVTGFSFWDSDRDYGNVDIGLPTSGQRDLGTTSYGIYGEVTYPLTDALKLTGGLRVSRDRKTYDARYFFGTFATPDSRDLKDTYATGRAAISYAITPEANIYVLGARGYKSGGFNEFATSTTDSEPFRAARVNTAEIGFKSVFPSTGLNLNAAVFYNNVKDDHLLGFNPMTFASNILNADTESFGAELEGSWNLGQGLVLSGAATYIDAEIKSDVTGVFGGDVSAGNQAPDVPHWSGSVSLSWDHALPDFLSLPSPALNAHISYRYQGERAADVQNSFDLEQYGKLDLRAGISTENAELYFWGDNLTDNQYDLYGFGFGFPGAESGAPARGRTIGFGVGVTL